MALTFVPAIAVAPPPPMPTTWWVDATSAGGDGTEASPFAHITSAIATASPGDTVMVKPGYYDDEDFPLWPLDGMTIKGVNGSDETTVDAGWGRGVFMVAEADGVTIEGLSIVRGSNEYGGGINVIGGQVTVKDCFFSENIAMYGGAVSAMMGEPDRVEEAGLQGSLLPPTAATVVLDGCTFYRNGWLEKGARPKSSAASRLMPAAVEPTIPPYPEFYPEELFVWGGGGVWSEAASMTVTGCEFIENAAGVAGGGLGAEFSNLTVDKTEFDTNVAWSDALVAGIAPAGIADLSPAQLLTGDAVGGGVFLYEGYSTFADVDLHDNLAEWGGAMLVDVLSSADVEDCTLSGNKATVGGGIVHTDPAFIWEHWFTSGGLKESPDEFLTSLAQEPLILREGVTESPTGDFLTLSRTELVGNGAEYVIPAMFTFGAPIYMENCLVAQNVGEATAVYCIDWDMFGSEMGSWINHTTFAHNYSSGGSVLIAEGTIERSAEPLGPSGLVSNSVFWDNRYEGDEAYDVLGPEVCYSDLQYGYESFSTTISASSVLDDGNINEDPQWADPVSGDYRLTFGSPCVDTASPAEDYIPSSDLDLGTRPLDGDLDGAEAPDMGCYELEARDPGTTERLFGENRFGTAVDVSRDYFPTADTVVIARADVFSDALAAAGLAGYHAAPILLAGTDVLPSETRDEIVRLGADKAVVLGGPEAVGPAVVSALEALGLEVQRIGGVDRYDTAALLAEELALVTGETTPSVTFIARGDLWADALAVSPVAYALQAPTLLVKPDELPARTVDILQQSPSGSAIIVGGKEAVDAHVAKGIASAATSTDRVSGADRYETAAAICEFAVAQGWSRWDVTGLATGDHFADALTGGAGIGRVDGVLLLTDPSALSGITRTTLTAYANDITRLDVLGGVDALAESVKNEAALIVR